MAWRVRGSTTCLFSARGAGAGEGGIRPPCVLRSPPQPWLHTAVTQGASERLHAQAAPSSVTSEFTEDTR